MRLKQGVPVTFDITYDVTDDGKVTGDISTAKFFLARYPAEADDKYMIKTYGSGLTYSAGTWSVTVEQDDLDVAAVSDGPFFGILGIQYSGDTDFREPDLLENGEVLQIWVDRKYSNG